MPPLDQLLQHLRQAPALLVSVTRTAGSVPRERGAWLAVCGPTVLGSIGGGQLEHQAIAHARHLLAHSAAGLREAVRYALGPSLGQCCGGIVELRYEHLSAIDIEAARDCLTSASSPLALFGGGHVGAAIVRLLADLPFSVRWIDSRDEVFPPAVPSNVRCEHSDPVQAAVADLPARGAVLIMSFSHAEDLEIVAAALLRQRARGDLRYIGLIGSKTKWATFRHRLTARGFSDAELAQVTCPIGLPGIAGKQPPVIAVAVVAQLLALGLAPAAE
ncbi:xanthine dehydrogenase accessory protein XdhC [Ottowia testudinis]|uniref:Xanthine dehydrogenase accessory protein XdhC n=1 Tax=Ottowia testudinis TaxID=2816950 RepID=A0A975H531_9BURK|nr:xanthine dehydrogenase accessory protein XdhC [Ottowia testudinis]QTD47010.1 xanthine dehydrogenase accessory protein XdhC [Ottowia testudinis]